MWTANARIRAALASMDNAASLLEKLSAAKRRKKRSKKGLSEHMRAPTNKRHGNLTK